MICIVQCRSSVGSGEWMTLHDYLQVQRSLADRSKYMCKTAKVCES